MMQLDEKYNFMTQGPGYVSRKHDGDKLLVFERGGLLWIFNFHPYIRVISKSSNNSLSLSLSPPPLPLSPLSLYYIQQSFTDYKIGVDVGGKYRVALDSDAKEFDGHGHIDHNIDYYTKQEDWDGRSHSLMVYIPSRVALVLCKVD